jgi:hypothetical protein
MDFFNLGIAIRDDLRDHIQDPISRPKPSQWIHYDNPDNVGKTPVIYVERVPSATINLDIVGSGEQRPILNFRVHIIIDINDHGVVDDTPISGNELLDKVTTKVYDFLEDKSFIISSSTSSTTYYIKCTNIGGQYPIGNIKKAVTLGYEVWQS